MSKITYTRKSEEEIKTLARDVFTGRVIGSWMLERSEVESVFPLLGLLDGEQASSMPNAGIVHVYEYLDKAGPLSVNGLPTFHSCRMLNREDAIRLANRIDAINKAFKAALSR